MIKDILFLIIGAIIGALFSWLITHLYYKRANGDNELDIQKLKEYIKEIINNSEKAILNNSLQYDIVDEWEDS